MYASSYYVPRFRGLNELNGLFLLFSLLVYAPPYVKNDRLPHMVCEGDQSSAKSEQAKNSELYLESLSGKFNPTPSETSVLSKS